LKPKIEKTDDAGFALLCKAVNFFSLRRRHDKFFRLNVWKAYPNIFMAVKSISVHPSSQNIQLKRAGHSIQLRCTFS